MRDIRARISQQHGIELSSQQIQELAARRLEAILEPRNINPTLMQQLRQGAERPVEPPPASVDEGYSFEATTIYASHRGILRFIRRLLNPLLKLFFNPNPIIHALHAQAEINRGVATREAERVRLQAEWNALHYEILQRLVTDVSRVSIEMQSLALKAEALTARVDFNDRRVRTLESAPSGRQSPRQSDSVSAAAQPAGPVVPGAGDAVSETPVSSEGARRRRRRRRGRRGGGAAAESTTAAPGMPIDDAEGDGEGEEIEGEASTPVALEPPPQRPTPPPDEPASPSPETTPDPGPPER